MTHRILATAQALSALALWTSAPLPAQQETMQRLELRVTSTGASGSVIVDRGERDKVRVGDVVLFYPGKGGVARGTVTELAERSASVALQDRNLVPVPGTRGEVLIPKARMGGAGNEGEQREKPESAPEHEPWKDKDESFAAGKPLLAQVTAVRPEERAPMITGRAYMIADLTNTPHDGTSNSFFRGGTDVSIENPFGRGGTLRFNPEIDYRTEQNDIAGSDLLVRRLSYAWGGTRFSDTRGEVGRFLQHGLPELGVLDGIEWGRRRDDGQRYGVSVGYMPEPDDDFETLDDFQIAAYYLWSADPSETLTIGGGLQQTFHHGDADRQLLIAKLDYLPLDGWSFHGATWVDFHGGDDNAEPSLLEVSQAVASIGRRWANGNRLDLSFLHSSFPELLRHEFLPVTPNQLADDRYDRLVLSGSAGRAHGLASIWNDEDGSGGSLEAGIETRNLFLSDSRFDVTVFGGAGEFTSAVGARFSYGRFLAGGFWEGSYEIANHHQEGFAANLDDLAQHRLRGSGSFRVGTAWDIDVYAQGSLWDEEVSTSLGFHVQRRF